MQDFRALGSVQHQAEEFEKRLDQIELEFQQSLKRTKGQIEQFQNPSSKPLAAENVWPIVTLTATVCLGLTILAIREHRRKRHRQRIANHAAAIVALIWEDADPGEIRRTIDEFQIDRADAETFKNAMMMNALFMPMPWYRVDIPKLLEAIGGYVAGQPWSVKAEEVATDHQRSESNAIMQASADASRESLQSVPAATERPPQLEVICPNGHTFAVPVLDAGAHRTCPQCGSRALVNSE